MKLPKWWTALAATALLTACGGDTTTVDPTPPVVEPPRPVAISVSPASVSFASIGDTATVTARVTDQHGAAFSGTVTWTSDNPDVFTVDAGGLVTAVGNGTGTVRASFQQLNAAVQVTVRQVAASIAVSPELDTLFAVGDTVTLTAEAADANGHPIAQPGVAWESSAPRVATVDSDGLVTAVGEGQALITASAAEVAGSAVLVAATVTRIAIQALDTMALVPIDAGGGSWTYEVSEARWLEERPVARLTRVENPAGVEVEVLGPGWVQIDPVIGGARSRSVRIAVAPPQPFVVSLTQDDWPASDAVTARGYAVDRIVLPAFLVGGESAIEAFGDSAEMRFTPPPLQGGECVGDPVGEGTVSVVNVEVEGATNVRRLAGPVAILDPGESQRLAGADSCLRLWAQPNAAYALAGVERSAIDASRFQPSPINYGGTPTYEIEVIDRTVEPSRPGVRPRISAAQMSAGRHPAPPRLHPPEYSVKGALEGLDTRTEKWKVGDEFEWYTNDDREGAFEVVALYPPNVVFAVFKEDLESIWTDARAEEFDEIMNWLGSEKVQDLYRTVFGDRLPVTNTSNEQMVVMYNAGGDEHSTGVMIHNIDGERTTTTVHMRDADWGTKWWYHNLAAHELAHAWERRNGEGFAGTWSGEGIANWFADENTRLATGTPLDANWDADEPLRGLRLRLPWYGDFLSGYRESHPYLRFLVTRLMVRHGQSYASAARRVIKGTNEDWYGHYFIQWNEWGLRGRGKGLVEQMREVVPGWDPVESRLDWMISFALDDRGGLPEYDLPFIDRAWQHFEPWETIRVGGGQAAGGQSAIGGNYYFMVENPLGVGGSIHLNVTDGDADMEWKLVRYR